MVRYDVSTRILEDVSSGRWHLRSHGGSSVPPCSSVIGVLSQPCSSRSPRYAPDNNRRCQGREKERKLKRASAVRRIVDVAFRTMNDRRAMDRLLIPHSRGPFFANVGSMAGVGQMERETWRARFATNRPLRSVHLCLLFYPAVAREKCFCEKKKKIRSSDIEWACSE